MDVPVPLKLDAVNAVNNQLAIEYLKKKKSEFRSLGLDTYCDTDKYVLDNCKNKIYYTHHCYYEKYFLTNDFEPCTDKDRKMRDLANKIEENTELFCQLENLIRGRCMEEVKNCDIKLIVQNLRYWSTQTEQTCIQVRYILMAEESPLAVLGLVAQMLMYNKFDRIKSHHFAMIQASSNTAAVCYLFTELCRQVGLDHVYMIILENSKTFDLNEIDELLTGCTGVITNNSDVDSAVDALLSSTTKYPWKLRRILIQESVYECGKEILKWKYNLKPSEETGDVQENARIRQMCANVFVYGDKRLLLDYTGEVTDVMEQNQQVILVEAYRTPKELLSLLAQYNPFYLSLWSSDISEANEIAFATHSATVWVNDYGTFDGPWKASQAFYSVIQMKMSVRAGLTFVNEKLDKLRDAWLNIDCSKRVEIVRKAVESYVNVEKDMCKDTLDFVNELRNSLSDIWDPKNDLVKIQKGNMCIVIDDSIEVIAISDDKSLLSYCSDYIDVIKSLVDGNAVSVKSCKYESLFKMFVDKGLPVIFEDSKIYTSSNEVPGRYARRTAFGRSCHLTKVVFKNFGTIFAN